MHHKPAAYTRTFAAKLARVGLDGLVVVGGHRAGGHPWHLGLGRGNCAAAPIHRVSRSR